MAAVGRTRRDRVVPTARVGPTANLHGVTTTGDATSDAELSELESDLDSVEEALEALDTDDLQRAEELADALGSETNQADTDRPVVVDGSPNEI